MRRAQQLSQMLDIQEISKSYKSTLAVDAASFAAHPGRVLGLLGPNGAGKSSILRMVTNIIWPDSGEILLDGERITHPTQSKVGYMPEERGLYRQMRVLEQLVYIGRLKGLSGQAANQSAQHWLKRLGAEDWASKRPRDLSRGMQQKVQFALTLVHAPRLLILDEPFSGLDPLNAELMEEVIRQRREAGDIVVFASHLMEQVEGICDEICLIAGGKVLVTGELQEIKESHGGGLVQLAFEGAPEVLSQLEARDRIEVERIEGGEAEVRLLEGFSSDDLLDALRTAGGSIKHLSFRRASLREIFIDLVRASEADGSAALRLEDAA